MAKLKVIVFSVWIASAWSQRPSFAGSRPIGYPELTEATTSKNDLGNRFGESGGTTQRLPIEAMGDKNLIDRLSKLPIDQQPFWFINWQALEAHRENPQTYPQRPNHFAESNPIPISNTKLNAGSSKGDANFDTQSTETANSYFENSSTETAELKTKINIVSASGNYNNDSNIDTHDTRTEVYDFEDNTTKVAELNTEPNIVSSSTNIIFSNPDNEKNITENATMEISNLKDRTTEETFV